MGVKIAFCGKMCAGKSTACGIVCDLLPDAKVHSFATPIKEIATAYFGMETKDRELLVKIGQFGRSINPDIWVKCMLQQCANNCTVVCDDLRQHNEFCALRNAGWFLVKLKISTELQRERMISQYGAQQLSSHTRFTSDVSETEAVELPDGRFDAVICMDGTLGIGELRERICGIIQQASNTDRSELDSVATI